MGEVLAEGPVVVAVAAGIAWGPRRRSAVLRHAMWVAASAVPIVLPVGGAVRLVARRAQRANRADGFADDRARRGGPCAGRGSTETLYAS